MNECPRHKLPRHFAKQKCSYCTRLYAYCKACTDETELLEIGDTCQKCYVTKGLPEAREKKTIRDNEARITKHNLEELQRKYDKVKIQLQSLVKQYKDLKGLDIGDNATKTISTLKTELESTRTNLNEIEKIYPHLDELSLNLDTLVDSKDLTNSDITIECSNKTTGLKVYSFKVHSLVLSARSNVLKQLCKQALADKSNRFRFDDIKQDVLKEIIRYIYTGRINITQSNAVEMYIISERFNLKTLKVTVENFLIEILNKPSAVEILKAFDKYNNYTMKSKCIQLINSKYPDVFESIEWSKLKSENPDLVYQVYESKIIDKR